MNTPLTPDRVRALCAELGYTTQRTLSPAELTRLTHNKPNGLQSPCPTAVHFCDCGEPATHKHSANWECERCKALREAAKAPGGTKEIRHEKFV